MHCIVAGLRVFILQYTVLYCRKKISVLQWALYCKMAAGGQSILQYKKNCIVTRGLGCWARWGTGQALGARRVRWAGAGRAQSAQAGVRGPAGAGARSRQGRAWQAGGTGVRALGECGLTGQAAGARGAR